MNQLLLEQRKKVDFSLFSLIVRIFFICFQSNYLPLFLFLFLFSFCWRADVDLEFRSMICVYHVISGSYKRVVDTEISSVEENPIIEHNFKQ